LSDFYKSP